MLDRNFWSIEFPPPQSGQSVLTGDIADMSEFIESGGWNLHPADEPDNSPAAIEDSTGIRVNDILFGAFR